MSLPTLLVKGKLVAPDNNAELQKQLNEWVPIEYIIEWFRTRVNKTGLENRVLIIKSETASGKSTALPPEIFKAFMTGNEYSAGIICTQPRVLTAIENVNEILVNYSKVLRRGETIGWSTRYNKLRPRNYGLLSATIGTLALQLKILTDVEIISKYRFILIDEAHERELQTDMTVYMLKNFLLRNKDNPNCPFVVLMSATFDPAGLLKYFNIPIQNFIHCMGESAGFEEKWNWNEDRTVNNYPQSASLLVEKIIKENPDEGPERADILIFLPGKAEFHQTYIWLSKINAAVAKTGGAFTILQIDSSSVQNQDQDYRRLTYIPLRSQTVTIDGKDYVPKRRVILSTNVAETGLTLADLKYVIDAGFNREIEYNPVVRVRALLTKAAPQSRIIQRRGRAGRKFKGVFYPLYPKYIFDKLQPLQFPQILIDDISPIMLDIIGEQIWTKYLNGDKDPEFLLSDIDMIDIPSPDALSDSMEKLYSLGVISPLAPKWHPDLEPESDNKRRFGITNLGIACFSFNALPIECVRMILSAYFWESSVFDMITIAAYSIIGAKNFVARADVDVDSMLPPPKVLINWVPIFKAGLPGFITTSNVIYKIKLLISDEFINGLILFNAVKYIISQSESKHAINDLRSFCDKNKIAYNAVLDFIRTRDDIIEQMLNEGFELFSQETYALVKTTENTIMDAVTKMKYCIYDGYRNNILIKDGNNYKTPSGVIVTKPSLFNEDEAQIADKTEYGFVMAAMPNIVIYRELSMKYNIKTSIYSIIAEQISVADGFVNIDPDFLT